MQRFEYQFRPVDDLAHVIGDIFRSYLNIFSLSSLSHIKVLNSGLLHSEIYGSRNTKEFRYQEWDDNGNLK